MPLTGAMAQDQTREITGALVYRERIALPPDADVMIAARGAFDTVLGEARFGTEGRQVPLPFAVELPADLSGHVEATIRVGGQPRWIARDIPFSAGGAPVDLGEVRLTQVTPLDFVTRFDCNGEPVEIGILGERAILRWQGREIEMEQARSASGARYLGGDENEIEFWTQGDEAMLSIGGEKVANCIMAADDTAPYTAGGNEPGWHVTVGAQQIEIVADYGDLTRDAPRPDVQVTPGAYAFDMPEIAARLTLHDRLCHDDATGMPHPHEATLMLEDRELRGCGGSPASLLTGAEWTITQVGGRETTGDTMPAIGFDEAGRIAGHTGCNRFFGGYNLTGEGLTLGQMGATMMACPDDLMVQERRVLEALEQVHRFDVTGEGALQLIGGPEGTLLLQASR